MNAMSDMARGKPPCRMGTHSRECMIRASDTDRALIGRFDVLWTGGH